MGIYYGVVDKNTPNYLLHDPATGQLQIFETKEHANESVTDYDMLVIEINIAKHDADVRRSALTDAMTTVFNECDCDCAYRAIGLMSDKLEAGD